MATKQVEKEHRPWINGVAGGTGAALAKTLMTPVQRIVVLRQIRDQEMHGKTTAELVRLVMNENGKDAPLAKKLHPFFRGNLTSVVQRLPYSGIQLMIYDRCKHALVAATGGDPNATVQPGAGLVEHMRPMTTKALAGGLSATIAGTVCFPLEVVRTRLMSKDTRYTKIVPTVKAIWGETGGPRHFYRGLSASLVQRVPDIMINFTVYESVKFSMERQGYSTPACIMAGGATSALAAIAMTFPLDTAKRCMAMAGQGTSTQYRSVSHCLAEIFKTEGVRGWYRGAELEAARCVPQVVLMWFVIDYCRVVLNKAFD